jgi:hypothetical protein
MLATRLPMFLPPALCGELTDGTGSNDDRCRGDLMKAIGLAALLCALGCDEATLADEFAGRQYRASWTYIGGDSGGGDGLYAGCVREILMPDLTRSELQRDGAFGRGGLSADESALFTVSIPVGLVVLTLDEPAAIVFGGVEGGNHAITVPTLVVHEDALILGGEGTLIIDGDTGGARTVGMLIDEEPCP